MALPRITGRIRVVVNGQTMLNKAGAVASGIGESGKPGFERNLITGPTGVHGVSETPILARLEVTLTDREDISLSALAAIVGDGTVIFQAAGGGKSYTMKDAVCVGNFSITGGEGETPVAFVGAYWTENVE